MDTAKLPGRARRQAPVRGALLAIAAVAIGFLVFFSGSAVVSSEESGLLMVAESDRQWTGVAVSRSGRIFVNYPRWSPEVPLSVAELLLSGKTKAYPDEAWNEWASGEEVRDRFVCVQSVYVDREDDLWILDTGNPRFRGVLPGAPKLVRVSLADDTVAGVIRFDESAAPAGSYLNDVRIDTGRGFAYITDSGLGGILVVELASGRSRRVLTDHPSTKSEGAILTVAGRKWVRADGSPRHVHSDGIALSPDGRYLYYQALTGRSLYRIETRWLRDQALGSEALGGEVERVGETGAADGLLHGPDGYVYLSGLEHGAIRRVSPDTPVETVVQDSLLAWPDSFAWGPRRLPICDNLPYPPAERGTRAIRAV